MQITIMEYTSNPPVIFREYPWEFKDGTKHSYRVAQFKYKIRHYVNWKLMWIQYFND